MCEPYGNLAEQILTVNEDAIHCIEDDVTAKEVLEHLAVCEHLRWEASHMMMGYKPTTGGTDDLKKLHCYIKPYDKLGEVIKHYDWLVVKNSLDTSAKEGTFTKIAHDQYIPQPIDTSAVQLPEKLEELGVLIAKNVHEVWAQSRMEEGWTYGKERNDELKQHPCLIPYEDLPEEEKTYDRNTAFGTLKLISKLGFKISKRGRNNK